MSSLCRASLLALALLATGCDREYRDARGKPVPETTSQDPVMLVTRDDPRAEGYENNAAHLAAGQQYYKWMNCNGCHSNGGGGIGPPLMDDEWRYGSSMAAIVTTIAHGRPNGMPAFAGKLTDQQMWELASYVRSMSALDNMDVRSGRAEALSAGEPPTLRERKPPRAVTPKQDEATVK